MPLADRARADRVGGEVDVLPLPALETALPDRVEVGPCRAVVQQLGSNDGRKGQVDFPGVPLVRPYPVSGDIQVESPLGIGCDDLEQLILSILSILSKKQRKDDGINNERTDPLRSASGYANAPDSTT